MTTTTTATSPPLGKFILDTFVFYQDRWWWWWCDTGLALMSLWWFWWWSIYSGSQSKYTTEPHGGGVPLPHVSGAHVWCTYIYFYICLHMSPEHNIKRIYATYSYIHTYIDKTVLTTQQWLLLLLESVSVIFGFYLILLCIRYGSYVAHSVDDNTKWQQHKNWFTIRMVFGGDFVLWLFFCVCVCEYVWWNNGACKNSVCTIRY